MAAGPQVIMVAGEASGDLHGAALVESLRRLVPEVKISGIGGPGMAAQGVEIFFRAEDLAVVGIAEVLPKAGLLLKALRTMRRHMRRKRPDLLILIDFPDFNFRLGKTAKKLGIKVLYYISPQVWAWRRGRARTMAGFIDRLAVIFPFEKEYMAKAAPGLKVTFVGHPSLDHPPEEKNTLKPLPVPQEAKLVGLLPGSRMSEVSRLLPLMMKAAALMQAQIPNLHFIVPLAPGIKSSQLEPYLRGHPAGLTLVPGMAAQVMAQAKLLLVASGTATLQAALDCTPMVVVYKVGWLNYVLAKLLIKVDRIAMPNLTAGRLVVPELIQTKANPESLAQWGLNLLREGHERRQMIESLSLVRARLGGPGASGRVARMAQELLEEAG